MASVAKDLPRIEEIAKLPVVVALVKMEEEALRLVKVAVVAFMVVPENKVSPKMEEFRLTVLPPETLMLVPPRMELRKEEVPTTIPLASVAKTLPKIPGKKNWPVVVALVRMEDEALKLLLLLKKYREEEEATPPVPLPNRMSLAVKMDCPVPPLATGNTPLTLLARLTEVR